MQSGLGEHCREAGQRWNAASKLTVSETVCSQLNDFTSNTSNKLYGRLAEETSRVSTAIGWSIQRASTAVYFVELLLGRVALVAQRPIVVKLSRERSVGRSVCLSSALHKNGGSDPDGVWRHIVGRVQGWGSYWGLGSVHGKGYFGGELGARHCNQWGLPFRSNSEKLPVTRH